MANFNLELGTIALPVMFFLFTKSLKQTITDKLLGDEDLTKSILVRLDSLSSKDLSQTMKTIVYEFEMNRISFCDKYNGKQLSKADWSKMKINCINSSLHNILPVQLVPVWYKCSSNLDKFCVNLDWIEMKGCFIESLFEQKFYYIQLWYKDKIADVLQNLVQIKSCIRRYTGANYLMSKKSQFLSAKL